MASAISLAGGVALGLASSLHCIGMCGGISVLFGYSGTGCDTAAASREQALLHGGRIASYTALGALAGGLGNAALSGVDPGSGHALLRWAAALSLGWIGLVTAGLAPAPAFLAHASPGRGMMSFMLHLPLPARRIAGGLAWGLLPCGMVYGALIFAMFAGTARGGALVMLGFGLGTLPALIAAGLGFGRMQAALRAHGGEKWLGAFMIVLALLSLVESPAALGAYCAQLVRPFQIP
jgi:sulfite exporter TauE/SafE